MIGQKKRLLVIVKFGIGFMRLTLFMIRKKYTNLDLSDVDLTLMEGYNIRDLVDGFELEGQGFVEAILDEAVAVQPEEGKVRVGDGNVDLNHFPPNTEFDVSLELVKNSVNVRYD